MRNGDQPIDIRAVIERTKREVAEYPQWMKDGMRWAVAAFQLLPGEAAEDRINRAKEKETR